MAFVEFTVERAAENGGDLSFKTYTALHNCFAAQVSAIYSTFKYKTDIF